MCKEQWQAEGRGQEYLFEHCESKGLLRACRMFQKERCTTCKGWILDSSLFQALIALNCRETSSAHLQGSAFDVLKSWESL